MKYNREEVENSKRIFKSATPKQDLSWYVKWTASSFLIAAFAVRSGQMYPFVDLCLSLVGVSGWLWGRTSMERQSINNIKCNCSIYIVNWIY